LFEGDGHGAFFFGAGLCNVLVGIGLVHLKDCAYVASDVYVGDVNGEDLEGGAGVEAFVEYYLGDGVGVLHNGFVGFGGADA
jgi:hypothetical protein